MSVMDMANVTCGILVGRMFFSLCSEVSYIYWGGGWWDGGDLCAEFTRASWSLWQGCWKWWKTAGKDLGIFQTARVLPVFVACREHCFHTGLCSPAGDFQRFPKEAGAGKTQGSPELICSAGGTGSLARSAQPCLHSSHPWSKVEKAGLPGTLDCSAQLPGTPGCWHCPEHQFWPCNRWTC